MRFKENIGQRLRRFALSAAWLSVISVSYGNEILETPDFETDVASILATRCLECHNASDANGGLQLQDVDGLSQGGDSGAVIVAGNAVESHLFERIIAGEMPPKVKGRPQKLPQAEIDTLRAWINAGAKWPEGRVLEIYERTSKVRGGRDWWSFQPVSRPPVPKTKASERVSNPIDSFIISKLEANDMQLAPAATKRHLIRRVYFDLIGLPPSWEAVESFVKDSSKDAYEKVVDGLLNSPQFGERWARHWLDLVRFAETCGYERDQTKPNVWKYRDWVIQSLNDDKPYDRFVIEQLAGDELPDRTEASVIATGFLRLGTWNDEPNDPHDYKYERLEDMVHATSTAFLGLTVKCARCHDHKFDPIYQKDYYRLASAFWAGYVEPGPRDALGGPPPDKLGYENVFGWTDRSATPPDLHLLKKGNPKHPGEVVEPGHLSTIATLMREFEDAPTGAMTTHRRLQFAKWIVDPKNPLTARVFVNRLWQHHFGRALVRTPNNFGFKGELPTHPELLDWLADRFVDGGWKMKPIHKLMVMSQAYRQSSLHPHHAEYNEKDFGNRLWWRADRRRLDAEAMRDAMLYVSGRLNPKMQGPSFHAKASAEALEGLSRKSAAWKVSVQTERDRRSVYMFTQRSLLLPLMTTFDFCDTTQPCGQRDVTTVAPQALALLNNEFVHGQSQAFAARVISESSKDLAEQIALAWRLALGRRATDDEIEISLAHVSEQNAFYPNRSDANRLAMASLCHVLLNSNEFIYVD